MPNKNPRCSKCGYYKMKFNRWLESTGKLQPYSRRFIWKLEVKCPNCGATTFHWRPRKNQSSSALGSESQKELKE